jgi:hypothetical protein
MPTRKTLTLKALDTPMLDVFGETLRLNVGTGTVPLTLKRCLIQVISSGNSPDPVKTMELPHALLHSKDGNIELEDADLRMIKELVNSDRSFTNVIRAQLITALEAVVG